MKARIHGSALLAMLLLTASVIAFGQAPGAVATQGQAVVAGMYNGETKPTIIQNESSSLNCTQGLSSALGLSVCGGTGISAVGSGDGVDGSGPITGVSGTSNLNGSGVGVFGIGPTGVQGSGVTDGVSGSGSRWGVEGSGTERGVYGHGAVGVYGLGHPGVQGNTFSETDNGVYGHADNSGGNGVYGLNDGSGNGVQGSAPNGTGIFGDGTIGGYAQGSITGFRGVSLGLGDGVDGQANNSCCSAVYGLNDGTGNGVAGKADNGTGVLASSTGGIALKVDGKAQFSRSGKAVVASGQSSVVVSNVALTSKSLVVATPQKSVAGVFVQGAVPNVSAHTVTISLNNTVGASYPVAWMVIERP